MGKARAPRPQASARPSSTAAPHAPQPVPLSSAQAAPPSSAHGSGPVRPTLRLRQPQLRRPAHPDHVPGQSPRTTQPYHQRLRSPQRRPHHLPPLTGAGPSDLSSGCVSPNCGGPPTPTTSRANPHVPRGRTTRCSALGNGAVSAYSTPSGGASPTAAAATLSASRFTPRAGSVCL